MSFHKGLLSWWILHTQGNTPHTQYLRYWKGRAEIWYNPLEFNPDRFMGSKIDPRGSDFQLIPFGTRRCICVGTSMGISLVEYNLGSLIHAFDWEFPQGMNSLNMEEYFRLALQKREPLVSKAIP
ncbi:hypothetical protein SUGI_1118630 [Cryptomeria japonica]|nr:hypothetical protein SUGI_1118630 [Cryptomeria japonica]